MGSLAFSTDERRSGTFLNPRRAALLVLAGAGVYALLIAVWLATGLHRRYDEIVLETAKLVVPALTHFPVGSSAGVEMLEVQDRGYVLVVIAALALVFPALSWRVRLARYLPLALLAFASHVVGLALQLHLSLALKTERLWGTSLLLPWEQTAITRAAQLLFLAGLQLITFLALVVAAWSFIGRRDAPAVAKAGSRRFLPAAAGLLIVLLAAGVAWWMREWDPRHAAAHAELGRRFLAQGLLAEAEQQYRSAVRSENPNGPVWLGLVEALERQGRAAEARNAAVQALAHVTDPVSRARLAEARAGQRGQP